MTDPGPREYRKLAVIMFTDIVGFSSMAQRDEARSLELLSEHNAIVRPLLTACDGLEIKMIGDAFLVEFGSAVQAVLCAIQVQHIFHNRNTQVSGDRRVELRIGLHLGDVIRTADDILGDGVNIAARIQPLADPNGVCVSQQVYDQVRGKLDATFVEVAKPRMKNIDAPIRVYAIRFPWTGRARGWGERLTDGLRFKLGKLRIVVTLVAGMVIAVGLSFVELHRPVGPSQSVEPRPSDPAPDSVSTPRLKPPREAPVATSPVPPRPRTAREAMALGREMEAFGDSRFAMLLYEDARRMDPKTPGLAAAMAQLQKKMAAKGRIALTKARKADAIHDRLQALVQYQTADEMLPPRDPNRAFIQARIDALQREIR